jgi:hypothetical protein
MPKREVDRSKIIATRYTGSLLDMVVVDLYREVTVYAGAFGSDFSAL